MQKIQMIFASTIITKPRIPHNLSFLKSQRRNFPNHRNSNLKHTNISNIFIYKAIDNYIYLGCSIHSLYITNPLTRNLPNALRLVCASRYAYQNQLRVLTAFPFFIIIKTSFLVLKIIKLDARGIFINKSKE